MTINKLLLLGLVVSISIMANTSAFAGKAIGKVTTIYTAGDLVFARIENYNPSTGVDASGCSTFSEMALDGSTSTGKNLYAMLLTARALGATVAFTGTGVCALTANREDISYGAITAN